MLMLRPKNLNMLNVSLIGKTYVSFLDLPRKFSTVVTNDVQAFYSASFIEKTKVGFLMSCLICGPSNIPDLFFSGLN